MSFIEVSLFFVVAVLFVLQLDAELASRKQFATAFHRIMQQEEEVFAREESIRLDYQVRFEDAHAFISTLSLLGYFNIA